MLLMISERMSIMVQRRIKLNAADVKGFVEVASKCDFEIDIAYNRYTVDAKSILGVLGMDLSQMLTVTYEGYNEAFENFLARCTLAC